MSESARTDIWRIPDPPPPFVPSLLGSTVTCPVPHAPSTTALADWPASPPLPPHTSTPPLPSPLPLPTPRPTRSPVDMRPDRAPRQGRAQLALVRVQLARERRAREDDVVHVEDREVAGRRLGARVGPPAAVVAVVPVDVCEGGYGREGRVGRAKGAGWLSQPGGVTVEVVGLKVRLTHVVVGCWGRRAKEYVGAVAKGGGVSDAVVERGKRGRQGAYVTTCLGRAMRSALSRRSARLHVESSSVSQEVGEGR